MMQGGNYSAQELTSVQSQGIDFLQSKKPGIDLRRLTSLDKRTIVSAGFGSIYFVNFEGDAPADPVKVGWSRKAFERIPAYGTYSPRAPFVHEVLYVRSFIDKATERLCNSATAKGADSFIAAHLDAMRIDSADVASIEKRLHQTYTQDGRHHGKEWFLGPASELVAIAKDLVRSEFDVPVYTHSSMLRMLQTWKKEAGLI